MMLQRLNTIEILGVFISPNMEINTLVNQLNIGLINKPELVLPLAVVVNSLSIVQNLNNQILSKINTIITVKADLKKLKRAFEIAVQAYNIGATVSMKLMDLKPAVNGSPLATGVDAALTPLKVAVEKATTELQNLEDELDLLQTELVSITDEYKIKLQNTVNNLMEKLSEIGGKNIEI